MAAISRQRDRFGDASNLQHGPWVVLAVAEDQADSILSFVQQHEPNAAIIGYVHDDAHKVTHSNSEIYFEHY